MVRLNEPAAPLESLEILRKRFLRQNKEIIKINADQAAKIRGLEAETSRLLSENITLREENIRLTHDLKKGRHALALDNVGAVKNKLQMFASGLTDLLAELAEAQSTLPNPPSYHSTPKRRSPKSSSREWRGGLNIADLAEQDGRLPPIAEGKYYPRRTLDAEEAESMMQTSPLRPSPMRLTPSRPSPSLSDSPNLGPPPVIQFDIGDPVKSLQMPASPSPAKSRPLQSKDLTTEVDRDARPLSANLETRKKRRTSTFIGDWEKASRQNNNKDTRHPTESEDAGPADGHVKAGGKRKFSNHQNDENAQDIRAQLDSTRTNKDNEKRLDLPIREIKSGNSSKNTSPERGAANAQQPRRALGEKPVNTDPMVSPAKSKSRHHKDRKNNNLPKLHPDDGQQTKGLEQHSRPDSTNFFHSKKEMEHRHKRKPAQIETLQYLEPEAPAPTVDVMSPSALSTRSTPAELTSRDTPPPGDLSGRPSRRSRPAVSYAEPNLRDKMRRPTKELVDAVGSDLKSSRLSNNFSVRASDEKGETTVDVPKWKDNMETPASPLTSKHDSHTARVDLDAFVSTDRKRRVSSTVKEIGDGSDDVPAESKVEQVINNSSRRLNRAREAAIARLRAEVESIANADSHAREQDVFEMASSSPESMKTSSRATRRMTSMPENMNRSNVQASGESKRKGGRRRDTMASEADPGVNRETDLYQTETDAPVSRNERMATRRRSMML